MSITIAMQLGLAPLPLPPSAKARRPPVPHEAYGLVTRNGNTATRKALGMDMGGGCSEKDNVACA